MALTFELLRPDDLLVLQVEARNLKLDGSDPKNPKLTVEEPSEPAHLVFQFPPQSITEKAYYETQNDGPGSDLVDAAGSVPARMAGPSRLVFQIPKGTKELPFRMAALLDWSNLNLVLSATAVGKPLPPPIVAPSDLQTALEIPYRIILSPAGPVGWLHATTAATHAGRTELWHTRIGKFVNVKTAKGTVSQLVEAGDTNTVPLRAIWSPSFIDHGALPGLSEEYPFQSAMTPRERVEMVILTSGVTGYYVQAATQGPWVPQPIQASRLFLSSLGGWLSSRGSWPIQPAYTETGGGTQQLDVSEWVHLATQGRDHYVRIVIEGYLYPFGHRAALIQVTERKVVPPDGATVLYPTAYLKLHEYIVVREKEKTYPAASYQYALREMPFWQSVRILTAVTPDIDQPSYIPEPAPGGTTTQPSNSFWINVGGSPFPFHLTAVDPNGSTIDFVTPLIFMDEGEQDPAAIRAAYKTSGSERTCSVRGQRIAYADPTAGDTSLKTTALFFDTEPLENAPPYPSVPFVPFLDQATVTIPALEQLLGTTDPVTIQLYSGYLANGLDTHAGVFAAIASTPPAVKFSADKAGGFANPNLTVKALSARKGLVAGNADDAAKGLIKPAEFFADLSAMLFGEVPLQALIPVDGQGYAGADQNAPEIRTVSSPNAKNPVTQTTKISWSPELQGYPDSPVIIDINQNGHSALTLNATLVVSLTGGPPQSTVTGELSYFQVMLVNVVALTFNSLSFSSKNGQKQSVKADLPSSGAIAFQGPLAFVQQLAEILPAGIFGGSGPSLDLLPDRIRVTLTIGLPPISIGVFALENITIMTGLDLPYVDGKPEFEFGFATRSAPFLLTVECLGGGGFVHLIVDADGVQMVEGSLEFGGQFSLDLGVASGGVHIMAGIYFMLSGTDSDLTGFVDVGGEVSVLGILSISLDLNLSLSYEVSGTQKLVEGRATLTVAVHVLFFSASVQLSMEKSFKADSGDPKVADVLTAQDWAEYAAAFA